MKTVFDSPAHVVDGIVKGTIAAQRTFDTRVVLFDETKMSKSSVSRFAKYRRRYNLGVFTPGVSDTRVRTVGVHRAGGFRERAPGHRRWWPLHGNRRRILSDEKLVEEFKAFVVGTGRDNDGEVMRSHTAHTSHTGALTRQALAFTMGSQSRGPLSGRRSRCDIPSDYLKKLGVPNIPTITITWWL
jgi:hypothetical protein